MKWKPKKNLDKSTTPTPKKVVFIDLQIISFKENKLAKHLRREDLADLLSKPRLN